MQSNWLFFLFGSFIGALLALIFAGIFSLLFAKFFIKWVSGRFVYRLLSEPYDKNIWEAVTGISRLNPNIEVENSLRAHSGEIIERPFGSARKHLNFDGLVFNPAQLATLPASENDPVDMKIVIGPKAKKPLVLDIPLIMGAMGYGVGLSEKVKIAIAKGTAAVGTATNSGEGGFLPEERAAAKYFILQYGAGQWSKDPAILRQADAIEVRMGQGARAGSASFIPAESVKGRAQKILQVPPNQTVVIPARHQEINKPEDLRDLVRYLREVTEGVPIGVKFCASGKLEDDIEVAIRAGVDFISLDGSRGGTTGGPPIFEDDFGLPSVFALPRAVHYLKVRGVKEQISLLVGGGFFTPGDCLKAIALGADGVYLGTAALFAMTHTQVTKVLPWEPPTQLVYYSGSAADKFDSAEGAKSLENFLKSCTKEIEAAIHALGKTSLHQVNTKDLIALNEQVSQVAKVPLAYDSGKQGKKRWTDFLPFSGG